MITRIEVLNYRCLRYIRQDLGPFHVLVGPNASGKTTFLDVIAFLGRLVSDGPEAAVVERTQNFQDLVWGRRGDRFELAIEAAIPDHLKGPFEARGLRTVRYEVAIGLNPQVSEIEILGEKVLLKRSEHSLISFPTISFPLPPVPPTNIMTSDVPGRSERTIVNKVSGGNDNYYFYCIQMHERPWTLPAIPLRLTSVPRRFEGQSEQMDVRGCKSFGAAPLHP